MTKPAAMLLAATLAAATSCGPQRTPVLYPATQRDQVAQEVLAFHEDRFLADHNQELAQAWQDYRRARERLVELWRQHASTVHVDSGQRRLAEDEMAQAKAEFIKTAERLKELSQDMASEAANIVRAALRIPPVLQSGQPGNRDQP